MSNWRRVRLVAARELKERVASRAFQVSTGFTLLLVIAALVLPALLGVDDPPEWTLGSVNTQTELIDTVIESGASIDDTTLDVMNYIEKSTLRQDILDGVVNIGVIDGSIILRGPSTSNELLSLTTAALATQNASDTAGNLGLSQQEIATLFASNITVEDIEEDSDREETTALAFIGGVLLFVSILTYGQWILIGVVEEKSSRVVEVVLGTLNARHLLAGKVLGIGVLGLAQLLLVGAIGFIGVRVLDSVELPNVTLGLIGIVVFWFILGFAFYATGFAVTGSLVSRQEEAQNASFPLTMVMLVSYFVASTALGGEDNIALRILSLIPPFSPLTMPVRQASGSATLIEIVIAAALMIGATMLLLRLGGRIYSGGLLRTGGKISVKEAFRSAED